MIKRGIKVFYQIVLLFFLLCCGDSQVSQYMDFHKLNSKPESESGIFNI